MIHGMLGAKETRGIGYQSSAPFPPFLHTQGQETRGVQMRVNPKIKDLTPKTGPKVGAAFAEGRMGLFFLPRLPCGEKPPYTVVAPGNWPCFLGSALPRGRGHAGSFGKRNACGQGNRALREGASAQLNWGMGVEGMGILRKKGRPKSEVMGR